MVVLLLGTWASSVAGLSQNLYTPRSGSKLQCGMGRTRVLQPGKEHPQGVTTGDMPFCDATRYACQQSLMLMDLPPLCKADNELCCLGQTTPQAFQAVFTQLN